MEHDWANYSADESSNDDQVLARNVQRLRKEAGLSQADLGQAMHDHGQTHWRQTTVSRVETGKQRLTAGEVLTLQRVLGREVIDGTTLLDTLRAAHPSVRDEAARRALAEAEAALSTALRTVQQLRELYNQGE